MNRTIEPVLEAIRGAKTIAMVSHIGPDGDTIGSALAMKLGLEQLGKQVSVFCEDKVPDVLALLPGTEDYRSALPEGRFDLLLSIDVSDERRMGLFSALKDQADHTAQIDHHGTNPGFMEANLVDGHACACGLLIHQVLKELGVTLNTEMAMCLYAAISTDTGNFAYDAVNAETFRVMAELMEVGFPMTAMNRALFRVRTPAEVRLLNRALNTLRLDCGGRVATVMLTLQDFEETGALQEHADKVVNYAIDMTGVCAAALIKERPEGQTKVSLRSIAPYEVSRVAFRFGGGGHPQASGCGLAGTPEQVRETMVQALSELVGE